MPLPQRRRYLGGRDRCQAVRSAFYSCTPHPNGSNKSYYYLIPGVVALWGVARGVSFQYECARTGKTVRVTCPPKVNQPRNERW